MNNQRLIITGTDTGIGKTIFSAMLTQALNGIYYKPIQSGMVDITDTQMLRHLINLDETRILPEAYQLNTPVSPHLSAEIDGVEIDIARLIPPEMKQPLIIEMAGGFMVPITRQILSIDIINQWNGRVILCARTTLGTINHSLLSIEALKIRKIAILGIVFIGDENKDSENIITRMGNLRHLGRLPILPKINSHSLAKAFDDNFNLSDFN